MPDFAERLRELRLKKDVTQVELGKLLSLSKQTISSYENRGSTPDPETLQRLADYFDVSVDYLLGRTDDPRMYTREASDSAHVSEHVVIEKIPGAWPVGPTVKVPVLGAIRAREPIHAEQNIEGWEEVPQQWVNGECFFLRVTGDSMTGARIQEVDLVFVRRQDFAENGDIVVAIVNGEDATIKRIFFADETIILHPENPKYRPLVFRGKERDQVRIVGKVLWFRGAV
ncbi:MAG TPA: helix-turn-helix domain-containing protein [Clostridia bacterium]|nr:helix-turn-helix domain-containing protein [Clostridia bacterium]